MNTGFLFAATQFDDWRVDVTFPDVIEHKVSARAEFEDWFRVLRGLGGAMNHNSLVKPLSALWLSSFRFMESGLIEEGGIDVEELHVMLGRLGDNVHQSAHDLEARFERVRAHLTEFAQAAECVIQNNEKPQPLRIAGSVWDITWENLVINPAKERLAMYYKQDETSPFRLTVTPEGFVCEGGHSGHWNWGLHPGGRLALYVGGDYPVGWGWYTSETQQEISIHFYKSAYARAFERMRWVRSG